ncbi:TerD family protein [Rhodococcus coprophilus]|uniref:TerD family protein n=1 Tax=Rhodococcus coprophilus TaxID=38310 RepID=UPI0033DE61AD
MTHEFSAGQNAPLTGRTLRFAATAQVPLDLCAFVVDDLLQVATSDDVVFYNQPATAGVRVEGDTIVLEPDALRPGARVLCAVGAESTTSVSTTLCHADGTLLASFHITPVTGTESALLCWEIYRRNGNWKMRALGAGYAGGLAEMFTAHGVVVDEPADVAPAHADTTPPTTGTELPPSCELVWRIFEDASRSAAAYVAAHEYAQHRLDDELSVAVADPAARTGPAAETARAQAHRRCEELVAAAEARHRADSVTLTAELETVDAVLPASLASWDSGAWRGTLVPGDGVRVGELSAPERGALRLPLCVPLPLGRPLWIDGETAVAGAVASSLALRLLSARPGSRLDIIDPSGSLRALGELARPMLAGPPIHDVAGVAPKLKGLAEAADLTGLALSSGADTRRPEPRVVVLAGLPHGFGSIDLVNIVHLARMGSAQDISIVITGADDDVVDNPAYDLLHDASQHLPASEDGHLADPWTNTDWRFAADTLPGDTELLHRVVATLEVGGG